MSESGIFLDILARLNLASVDRVLKDVNSAMREGGKSSSRAFSEGFTLDGAKAQFSELSEASNAAYREMSRGLDNLRIQEARLNDLRANNFKRSTQVMIDAQRDFDIALANSMKLQETANTRAAESQAGRALAADTAAWRQNTYNPAGRDPEDRGRRSFPVPLGRVGNTLGVGAAIGVVAGAADSVKQAAKIEDALNRLVTVTGELPGNIKMIQDTIAQIAVKTGYNPQDLADVALQGEKRGYRGKDLGRLLDVTAQLSRQEKIPLDEALQGISITAQNYKKRPDQLADVASQLNVAVGRSGTSMQGYVGALPNVEPRAAAAGIPQEQVWGVLSQLTRSGLSPERAAQNEDSLIRSLASPNGPMRDMLNTLFTQAGSKNAQGKPMTAADIQNNLPELGLPGAVNEIINKGVLPNLSPEQRVLLPAVFKNSQNQENIEDMLATFTDPKTRAFANSAAISGGAMSPMQVTKAAQKAGVPEEDISRLRDYAKAEQVQHGFGAQLKGRDSDVQSIAGVLRKAFGTAEASRVAMTVGYGDNNPAGTQAETAQAVKDIGGAHADAQGNVEGFAQSMDTTIAQADRAKAAWHNVANTFGHELSPAVKDAMSGLADFGDWLTNHQGALDAFAATLGTIASIWAGDKLLKGLKAFTQPTTNLLKWGADKFGPGNLNTVANPHGGAGGAEGGAALSEGVVGGSKEGAPILSGGVSGGAKEAAGILAGGVAAGGKDAAGILTEGVAAGGKTASEEIAVGMEGAGARAGGGFMAAINPVLIGSMIAQAFYDNTDPSHGFGKTAHDAMQRNGLLPGEKPGGKPGEGQPNVSTTAVTPQPGEQTPTQRLKSFFGFARGTGDVHDPYSQPLMGQRDAGGDSFLGLINGKPVGLRGGEGILTPDAVARLGGKDAIDGLNAGKVGWGGKHGPTDSLSGDANPWADPLKVGTSFFGSFSQGVAKYSPFGKYLSAASHSLDDMTKGFEQSTEDHEAGGFRPSEKSLEQQMLGSMSPEQLAAAGITRTKHGGWKLPDGNTVSATPGGMDGVQSWLRRSLEAQGLSPDQARGILAMNAVEGGANDPQSLLGFTEGQAQGPQGHLQAFMNQWNDPSRRGAGGSIPGVGPNGKVTDYNAYMTWIRTKIVGQNGSPSDWQGNAQPSAGDYQNRLMGALGQTPGSWGDGQPGAGRGLGRFFRGGVVGYSTGGIVGYDGGGITVPGMDAVTSAVGRPPPAGPTAGNGLAPMDRSVPSAPGAPGKPGATGGVSSGGPLGDLLGGRNPQYKAAVPGMSEATKGAATAAVPGASKATEALTPQGQGNMPSKPGDYAQPGTDRNIQENPSQGVGKTSSKGFGVGGGFLGMAEGAAEMGANMMAPGAGQGMQMMFQLANRAIGYAGQLVGIGLEGLTETFMPHDSPKTQATSSLFGKIALGIAGSHPSPGNMAAMGSALQMKPKEDLDAGAAQGNQVMPMVHMDHPTINNQTGDHSETMKAISKGIFMATGGLPVAGGA